MVWSRAVYSRVYVCVSINLVSLERLGKLLQGSCSVLSPDNQFGYHWIIVFTDFVSCVCVRVCVCECV